MTKKLEAARKLQNYYLKKYQEMGKVVRRVEMEIIMRGKKPIENEQTILGLLTVKDDSTKRQDNPMEKK